VKVWAAQPLAANDAGVTVACGSGALELLRLQRPGGKRLAVRDFLAACPIPVGAQLLLR